MKLDELARSLNPSEHTAAYDSLVTRLFEAARPFEGVEELSGELPPVPRYLGPGAWLEAVRTDNRRKK